MARNPTPRKQFKRSALDVKRTRRKRDNLSKNLKKNVLLPEKKCFQHCNYKIELIGHLQYDSNFNSVKREPNISIKYIPRGRLIYFTSFVEGIVQILFKTQ